MLDRDDIRRHIEADESIEWVPLEGLLADRVESCVDGRGEKGIIGVPGGNAGELVLALATVETVTGEALPTESTRAFDAILGRYLAHSGAFYMHTDDEAVERLATAVGVRADSTAHTEADADAALDSIQDIVLHPPPSLRSKVLEMICTPAHVGCGHLRLMLQRPDEYDVRPELVCAVIRAVYRRAWTGADAADTVHSADIDLTILEGEHEEGAVVSVLLEGTTLEGTARVPTLAPKVRGRQMFVYHPQVARVMRELSAEWMGSVCDIAFDTDAYTATIAALGQRQLGATVKHLAADLPQFEIGFRDGGLDEVRRID